MTFKEIIERENQNTDSVWLYREGMFMKAYERSAFFAHTLIHEFKLSKRYIKTVNRDVNFTLSLERINRKSLLAKLLLESLLIVN